MHSRRTFLRAAAAGAISWPFTCGAQGAANTAGETLYNGIVLGTPWPPRYSSPLQALSPPYLASPPAVIPVDVGRQLFVDDFLVEEMNLDRTFHRPAYHPASPVMRPEREWEVADAYAMRTRTNPNPAAMVFSDGVFFDPADSLFKMWYMAGYQMSTCLATSADGISWTRPSFDVVPGTNIVSKVPRDSSLVWLDLQERDAQRRFKMSLYTVNLNSLQLFVSADGVHWREAGQTGPTGDRSTFFYNPFRRKWVFSIRGNMYEGLQNGRYRLYWEAGDFGDARNWNGRPPVPWVRADERDTFMKAIVKEAELYHLDCVAYESLLLGLFSVYRGEPNDREKINEVTIGFSRDGFHWSRPDRTAFLPVSSRGGDWNWGNVQSAGGCCLVVGDHLHFYVSGRQGRPKKAEPGVCSTGLAILRRDGFASLHDGPATAAGRRAVTTRPLRFRGAHLFVNADVEGDLRVEVLDQNGRVINGYAAADCVPIRGNSTRHAVAWKTRPTLSGLDRETIRLRFVVSQAHLYSFWIADAGTGRSRGYVGAGGPGFASSMDA